MPADPSRPPKPTRYLPAPETPWGLMHVVDRVVGREMLLGREEKDRFRKLLDELVHFTGLELLAWTCLDNHFHLLLRVPSEEEGARLRAAMTEERLLQRLEGGGSQAYLEETKRRLDQFRRVGKPEIAESVLRRLRDQTYDVSAFMHMLKRRFSSWYNKRHGRDGHFWQGRYRSVLVEDAATAVLRLAAYIDLNAVRAGVAKRPEDYPWCGYAEAVADRPGARERFLSLVRSSTGQAAAGWDRAQEVYRAWLREGDPAAAEDASAPLSSPELLRCRVRYFSDGVAIGSKPFVESVFTRYRTSFGPKRVSGARPMRWGDWGGLCALRDLQKDVIRKPRRGSPETTASGDDPAS